MDLNLGPEHRGTGVGAISEGPSLKVNESAETEKSSPVVNANLSEIYLGPAMEQPTKYELLMFLCTFAYNLISAGSLSQALFICHSILKIGKS